MCVLVPFCFLFISSFFCTPTLLTWLLFPWLIPLLFPSCSSYVAPRPHLIHSFFCLTLFSCPFFFFVLSLSRFHRGHAHTHNILCACKAFYTSNWPMCLLLQSLCTKYTVCLSCQIQHLWPVKVCAWTVLKTSFLQTNLVNMHQEMTILAFSASRTNTETKLRILRITKSIPLITRLHISCLHLKDKHSFED